TRAIIAIVALKAASTYTRTWWELEINTLLSWYGRIPPESETWVGATGIRRNSLTASLIWHRRGPVFALVPEWKALFCAFQILSLSTAAKKMNSSLWFEALGPKNHGLKNQLTNSKLVETHKPLSPNVLLTTKPDSFGN
ncbi:hypothetical protein PanWU01x14_034680, partial [Parasponia andersonii]